jgi:hypothetical protein
MQRIDTTFLAIGVICMAIGVCLGIYMGVRQDFLLVPVHAHLNLVGWASLTLFGLIYRAYPDLSKSPLALIHFLLAAPSALAFPVGIYVAIVYGKHTLAIVTAIMWLLGVLVFLVAVLRLALAGPHPAGAAERPPTHR